MGVLTGPSVLGLVADQSGPSLWRVFGPLTALQKEGYPCGWEWKESPLIGTIAEAFDGYLLPRLSWAPEHRRTAEAWFASVHRAGKFVVLDLDDDCLTQAETRRRVELNWTDGKSWEQLEAERFERIFVAQNVDGVTVSTQRLATVVRQYTDKPVIVVPNAADTVWFRGIVRATKREVPGTTIGWAGGRRHDRDVEMMAEAWCRIAARYPDVTFIVQGWLPDVLVAAVPFGRLIHLPWMPLEAYPSGLAQIDIACCSVADVPFNRCKSPIKAFEAALAGSAVVASPLLYEGLVENGSSGFIVDNVNDWETALATFIDSEATQRIMAKRLLRTVEKHHSLRTQVWRWPAAWQAIAASARARGRLVAV